MCRTGVRDDARDSGSDLIGSELGIDRSVRVQVGTSNLRARIQLARGFARGQRRPRESMGSLDARAGATGWRREGPPIARGLSKFATEHASINTSYLKGQSENSNENYDRSIEQR